MSQKQSRALQRKVLVQRLTARRTARPLTRAQRLALAPRPPAGAQALYLRTVRAYQGRVLGLVKTILLPALPSAGPAPAGLTLAPPPVHRQDAPTDRGQADRLPCGCSSLPEWYGKIRARRTDAGDNRYNSIFANLELALSELSTDQKLGPSLAEVATAVSQHNRAEVSRVLGLAARQAPGIDPILQGFLKTNVALIQSVTFDQLGRMRELVDAATAGQARVEDLQDQILGTFAVSDARAELIARDQVLKANADLTMTRQTQLGIDRYIWTTSGDERVRGRPGGVWDKSQANHWVLDGTTQIWTEAPVTNRKTGARNHPGRDYQCRCTATPVVDDLLYAP